MQNITIKYNVNTVDIKAASDQLTKAKAATDALTASSKKFTDTSTVGNIQLARTLTGLKDQLQTIKSLIDDTNKSDKARLANLSSQYNQVTKEINKMNASIYGTQEATQKATVGFGQMFTAVKLLLTAGIVKEVFDLTIGMATLAGKIEGVRIAFNKLPNSVLLLAELRKATHGMVDELTLMQKALQAQNFGIPIDKLGKLLEFASIRAQQTGISVDYLVDSIVTGLGRNSIKILDNLQINIGELKKRMQETGDTMQHVAINMIIESLNKMGPYIRTSETAVGELKTAWKEFGQEVAKSSNSTPVIDFFTNIIKGADEVTRALLDSGLSVRRFWELMLENGKEAALQAVAIKSVTNFKNDNADALKGEGGAALIDKEVDAQKKKHFQNTILMQDLLRETVALQERNKSFIGLQKNNTEEAKTIEINKKRINQLIDTNWEIQKEIKLLDQLRMSLGLKPDVEEKGVVENLKEQIKTINEAIDESANSSTERRASTEAEREKLGQLIGTTVTFREVKIAEREELERLIAVYTMSESELDKYLKGLEKGKVTAESWRKELDKQLDVLLKISKIDYKQALADMIDKSPNKPKPKPKAKNPYPKADRLTRTAANAGADIVEEQAKSILEQELTDYDLRIAAAKDFYATQEQLAGDNKNAIKKLKIQEAKELDKLEAERTAKAKKIALTEIIINTAANVIKSILANGGVPTGLPFGAIAAAMGASQYAIASRAKYAKGVIDLRGPGTETSDSIPADLSRGESVMTAQETRESKSLLHAIRAKRINDKVINDLVAKAGGSQAQDHSKEIIQAIKGQRQQDVIKIGSIVYEAKQMGANSKKYIRSRYLS